MEERNFVVNNGLGYYCGHVCGGRASWYPKFKLKFTQDINQATKFTNQGALNLVTNLFLMGKGYSSVEDSTLTKS